MRSASRHPRFHIRAASSKFSYARPAPVRRRPDEPLISFDQPRRITAPTIKPGLRRAENTGRVGLPYSFNALIAILQLNAFQRPLRT